MSSRGFVLLCLISTNSHKVVSFFGFHPPLPYSTLLLFLLAIFLSLFTRLSIDVFPPLSLPHIFQSELQSIIPAAEERSTSITITTTLILTGLIDKAADYSCRTHDSNFCSWSVQVVYHSDDDDGLVRWMSWYSLMDHVEVTPMFYCLIHRASGQAVEFLRHMRWHMTVGVTPVSSDEHWCVTMCATAAFRDH